MIFTKKGFESELQKIIATMPFATKIKDFTKDWSYLTGKESDEVMYLARIEGSEFEFDILIHSSIDPKTGKSKKDARGVILGFYWSKSNYGIQYAEMKQIKRTLRLAKHLREGFYEVAKTINFEYKTLLKNYKHQTIRKPALNIVQYAQHIAKTHNPPLSIFRIKYFTRGVFNLMTDDRRAGKRDELREYKRIANSVNNENFIVVVNYDEPITEILVDTVNKKVLKAVDIEGEDVSDKIIKIITKRDGLIVPLDASHYSKPPQDWYVRVD